ncbi:hypothetical protein M0R45_030789 [Rubus argutus]|uniref:Uncharacterized protein n=1 Tax=Rubus argutus TaxID=59490 RepID=A0AAW1WGE3_RUBAR
MLGDRGGRGGSFWRLGRAATAQVQGGDAVVLWTVSMMLQSKPLASSTSKPKPRAPNPRNNVHCQSHYEEEACGPARAGLIGQPGSLPLQVRFPLVPSVFWFSLVDLAIDVWDLRNRWNFAAISKESCRHCNKSKRRHTRTA